MDAQMHGSMDARMHGIIDAWMARNDSMGVECFRCGTVAETGARAPWIQDNTKHDNGVIYNLFENPAEVL